MFYKLVLGKYNISEIVFLNVGGNEFSIYQFEHKGVRLGFFNTILGCADAAAFFEEIIALRAEKLLYFGSCGVLDKKLQRNIY